MSLFAEVVATARDRKGWTLQEIADRLEVSIYTVESWLKPGAVSRRDAPEWAAPTLYVLATGKPLSVSRRGVRVTYAPATRRGRP